MNKRVLITGSNGQLGNEIKQRKQLLDGFDFYFTDIDELDITSFDKLEQFIHNNKITHIINCAAYTVVDLAEREMGKAELLNNAAVAYLANLSQKYNIKLIHISTDYVFDGNSCIPYKETDDTNPKSVYGATKLEGEKAILKLTIPDSVIIRTSWLYSSTGTNFVKTMLNLGQTKDSIGVVFDQVGSPTFAGDLAEAILKILPQLSCKQTEIYHFSNEGAISWYDFAKAIFELKNYKCKITPILTKDFPTLAKRPHFSVLDKSKIKSDFNLEIPHWFDSLKTFILK